MLEKLFKLKENKTTVFTEVIAGITTFLAMSYIIFVNPLVLRLFFANYLFPPMLSRRSNSQARGLSMRMHAANTAMPKAVEMRA